MQITIVYLDIDAMARFVLRLLCDRPSVVAYTVSRMQRYDKFRLSRARARKDMSSHKYEFEFRGKQRVGPRNFEESLVTPRVRYHP